MKKQNLFSSSVFRLIGGFATLTIFVLLLTFILKDIRPMAPGMTNTISVTSIIGLTSTEESTPAPTYLEQWRETAQAALMSTHFALIQTITPNPPPTGRPPTNTPAPFLKGVFEVSNGPFGDPHSYPMSAVWKEIVNGERTLVYVGGHGDYGYVYAATPAVIKGVVVVEVSSEDLSNRSWVEYEAPGAIGTLRIISVNGYRLALVDKRGEMFHFDVLTRQFVESLSATITAATITPLPPISPTAAPSTAAWSTEYPAPGTSPAQIYPLPATSTPIP
jgi:hypothetical protein